MSSTDRVQAGPTTVLAQTVSALCRLLINIVPLIENPTAPTYPQVHDTCFALCSALEEAPIRMVVDHNNIPRARSPNLLQTALPEFGDAVGSCALPTINTPASTTAELGHSTTSPSLQANTNLPTHTTPNKAVDQDYFPGFRFMNTDDIDNSPPARSPSPGLPQVVSPVNLATCSCDPPGNGVMGMGIRCWSCNVYNSITIPMSSGSCEQD